MNFFKVRPLAASLALIALCVMPLAAQSRSMTPQEQANLKLVLDWWREGFIAGHAEAADKYLAPDLIQHNPNFPQGSAAVKAILSGRTPVNPIPATIPPDRMPAKAFAKGAYVVLIWEREAKDPADPSKSYKYNDFDAFRVAGGKLVEHWDGATKNAGGGAAVVAPGGAIPPTQNMGKLTPQEQKNQDIATREMKDILQYGHVEVANEVMAPGYIQHNPNVATGRDGFMKFFGPRAKPEPIKAEWKNKPSLILTSGDLVFYMYDRDGKDPADPSKTYKYNWFDMLRVDNGMIQEHWDTARKAPPQPAK
jgi:predicted SnoaL-like aldol condensation-catalyzing enzyme